MEIFASEALLHLINDLIEFPQQRRFGGTVTAGVADGDLLEATPHRSARFCRR
jgi:hypothetical protein